MILTWVLFIYTIIGFFWGLFFVYKHDKTHPNDNRIHIFTSVFLMNLLIWPCTLYVVIKKKKL